jgi:hypothetical protein
MRMIKSLLKASAVAALVFALAWIRPPSLIRRTPMRVEVQGKPATIQRLATIRRCLQAVSQVTERVYRVVT